MPLIIHPASLACRAERLAGATSGPQRSIIRDARATESETPNSDASEEMNLSKSSKVIPSKIFNASSIDNPRCNKIGTDEVFEPIGSVVVDFVVERMGGQSETPMNEVSD